MTFILREASANDLEQMYAIEQSVFGNDAWSPEMLREELHAAHRHYLVLVEQAGDLADAVLGYAGILILGESADIQTIAVDGRARGQGQGRRLMLALADAAVARGVRDVFLEVRADNVSARGLYESLGFVEVGVRPRYYQPDGVDAIVMQAGIAPESEPEHGQVVE